MSRGLGSEQLEILDWIYRTAIQRGYEDPQNLVEWRNIHHGDKVGKAVTSRALRSLWRRGLVWCLSTAEEDGERNEVKRGEEGYRQTRYVSLTVKGCLEAERLCGFPPNELVAWRAANPDPSCPE